MTPVEFHGGRVRLLPGDCLESIKTLPDCSVDAVVTDPPYALVSISKRFGKDGAAPSKVGATGVYARASSGFMGKSWDTGERAFAVEFWAEIYRVLKPGGFVVAFSATRTIHRLTCAIEDAGFEIRDMIAWLYGSGFPKSHDVSKAIDKHLGAERTKVVVDAAQVRNPKATAGGRDGMEGATRPWIEAALERGYHEKDSDDPATPEGEAWRGWGTAIKPAIEPITLARKPLVGTVAGNVLAHGTGALNIDGCRVAMSDEDREAINAATYIGSPGSNSIGKFASEGHDKLMAAHAAGRWPANVVHDGSDEVLGAFPAAPGQQGRARTDGASQGNVVLGALRHVTTYPEPRGDIGSAARFFYSAKADADDRIGSKHPTIKPVALLQWLVRLVTPPGGTVLDPFSGTGTTGEAALREGFRAVLMEREPEYIEDIARRMSLALSGPATRKAATAKAKGKPAAPAPLFAEPPPPGGA